MSATRAMRSGALASLAALLSAMPLQAASKIWNNTGTDFNAAGSWTGGAPGSGDVATFNSAAATQPNLTADLAIQALQFNGGTVAPYTLSANPGTELTLTTNGSANSAALYDNHLGANGTNIISANIILGAAAGSTQAFYLNGIATETVVSGNISELNSGIRLRVHTGNSGRLYLTGSNSFTGGLLLDGGNITVIVGSDTAIPSSGTLTFSSPNGSWRSSDNTTRVFVNPVELAGAMTFGGIAAGQQGDLIFTGPVTLTNNFRMTIGSAGIPPQPATGVAFEGAIGESGGSRTLTVGGGTTGHGYLFLMGANTFTGQTTINDANAAGPVVINTIGNTGETASSLGAPTGANRVIRMAVISAASSAGILRYIGGTTSTDRAIEFGDSVNANANPNNATLDASGSGAITWTADMTVNAAPGNAGARNLTLTGTSTDDNTFAGDIPNPSAGTGNLNLNKQGQGTWVLKGSNSFAGTLTVSSGKLVLDYADNATVLTRTNNLTFGGGTLEFKGNISGNTAETLGNVTFAADTGLSRVRIDENGGSGTAITLGTLTVGNGRAILFDLDGSAASSVKIGTALTANGSILIRTSAGAHDFASNGNNAANPLTAVNSATSLVGAGNGSTVTDYLFTDDGSVGTGATGPVSARSLRIAPTLNNQTMTINNVGAYAGGGAAGLVVTGGGLLYDGGDKDFTIAAAAGANGVNIRQNAGGGTLFLYHFGTGKLTIGERVYLGYPGASPGTAGAATPLTLAGTGLFDWLGGCNVINGGQILVHGATVRLSGTTDPVTLDTTATGKGSANLALNGGGVIELVNGNLTRNIGTGAGAVQWKGDGGFSAFGGNRSVSLAGGAALTWGDTSFVPANNALVLASAYSDSTISFQNGLNFGHQQRVVRVNNGSAAVDAQLTGTLAGGYGGGLIKEGAGTLELTAGNTYAGETWVRDGTLLVNGNQAAAKGTVVVSAGATLGGNGIVGGKLSGSGLVSPGNSPGILTATQVDPSGGLDFGFEFGQTGDPTWSNAGASGNDVQRLTDASAPFTASLGLANELDIYFRVSSLTAGDIFRGGFFTDLDSDFTALVSGATYNYFVLGDGLGGDATFNGTNYYTLANYNPGASVIATVVQPGAANFAGGTISDGWVQQFEFLDVIPEPSVAALLVLGLLALGRRWQA